MGPILPPQPQVKPPWVPRRGSVRGRKKRILHMKAVIYDEGYQFGWFDYDGKRRVIRTARPLSALDVAEIKQLSSFPKYKKILGVLPPLWSPDFPFPRGYLYLLGNSLYMRCPYDGGQRLYKLIALVEDQARFVAKAPPVYVRSFVEEILRASARSFELKRTRPGYQRYEVAKMMRDGSLDGLVSRYHQGALSPHSPAYKIIERMARSRRKRRGISPEDEGWGQVELDRREDGNRG